MTPQQINTQLFNYITTMSKCSDFSDLQSEVLGFLHACDWLDHQTDEIKAYRASFLSLRTKDDMLKKAKEVLLVNKLFDEDQK